MSFDAIPIWGVFLATATVILGALELGYRVGQRRQQRGVAKTDVSAGMVGATMGLLAFMMAFTFNGAATRNEARKLLVVDDANAIEKTWLRAGFLADSQRVEVRRLLDETVSLRLGITNGTITTSAGVAQADSLNNRLWAIAERAGREEPSSEMTALFVESLNEMFDVQLKRLTVGARNRVAPTVWLALYALAAIAMGMMGIQNGLSGNRQTGIAFALALSFSIVLCLIADLDRPQEGLVNVSQQAIVELQQKLRAH